ncbi:hypothetical protein IWX90DRAFT_465754 [Phyllosticta citrichinensis]|uniref:C3H1-type domain-containing protein n=1 Tax=Phyllosticta citrichinensis TaxID=1130410 RepID=A0ABR1XXW0_9PEZI
MTSFGPQIPPPNQPANGSRVPPSRHSRDYSGHAHNGANGNGQASAVPIHNRIASGPGHMRAMSGFEGARSPPNSKSTAHVPCKFFRQGVCQAGKACPFLHSTEPATETAPCKYFQKGNCKFGAKCALAHILPDGRRVNGPGMGMGRHPYGRPHYPPEPSLLTQQAMAGPGPGPQSPYPYMTSDDPYAPAQSKQIHDMIPTIDQTFSSNPGSNFGSPPNDARLPTSPVQKGLSVLDAPLPASFDSQGISHMARYGPIAASVPSRFGLESSSPPSSYTNKPAESAALRNLHNSAFGEEARARNGFGSSPPPAAEEPFGGRRIMHSERFSRPKMMSASLGTRSLAGGDDWDENFAFEEDLVPNSLHELLTPQEKMRRFSRAGEEDHSFNHRQSLSGIGTPGESKVGSPLASSPSRFGALFSRTHKPVPEDAAGSSPGASAFGHVGSPLRNSSLIPNLMSSSPGLRPIGGDRRTTPSSSSIGDPSPFGLSSPPRQASMSMISQQLQRTRLSSLVSDSKPEGAPSPDSHTPTHPHPGMPRLGSASSVGSVASASGAPSAMSMAMRPGLGIDHRAVSSTSIGRERIEEEQEQGLFDMEEEEERALSVAGSDGRKAKRYSGISVASAGGSASGNTSTAGGTASGGSGSVGGGIKKGIFAT